MVILSGDKQQATINESLPAPLVVQLTRSDGTPLANTTIIWGAMGSGYGSLAQSQTTTDAHGISSNEWTLGSVVGTQSIVAEAPDFGLGVPFSATGFAGPPPPPPPPPIPEPAILHYDGSAWTSSYTVLKDFGFSSVWSNPQVTLAGGSCTGGAVLPYYSGSWHPEACSGQAGLSLWGFAPNDVYAVTRREVRLTCWSFVYHFNGSSWDIVYGKAYECFTSPTPAPTLNAVGGRNAYDVIAVGNAGTILRGDGLNWPAQQSGTTKDLLAVWGDPNSAAAFVVGESGTILYYDGTQWQTQVSGTSETLLGVWGSSASDVFAVGADGTILHYDGVSWRTQVSGTTQQLQSVWGTSRFSVYAVGKGSTILHFDGSHWAAQPVGTPIDFTGVSGNSDSDVFAVGIAK